MSHTAILHRRGGGGARDPTLLAGRHMTRVCFTGHYSMLLVQIFHSVNMLLV